MPLYLINNKGKKDHRLISASSPQQAQRHFIGKFNLDTRTITDAAEGAQLGKQYELEIAGEPAKAGEAPSESQDGKDEKDDDKS